MWGILRPFHGQSKCLSTEVLWCMIEVSNLINFYSNRRESTWCCRNCHFRNSQQLKIRSLEVWIQKSTFMSLKIYHIFFVQEITDVLEMRVNMVASTSGVDIDVDVPPDSRRIFTSTSVLVSLIIFRHKKMAINLVCFYEEQWNRSTVISCYIFFLFLLCFLCFYFSHWNEDVIPIILKNPLFPSHCATLQALMSSGVTYFWKYFLSQISTSVGADLLVDRRSVGIH